MRQEDRQLLLKDLSARLPYGVKVSNGGYTPAELSPVMLANLMKEVSNIKPYLRPMSSMTEDEKEEYEMLQTYPGFKTNHTDLTDMYDWLNEKKFDYRGLIPMELALEASIDMYKTE